MVGHKCIVILLFAVSAINCENCVTYDFGSNFYNSFNNGNPVCSGMAQWKLGHYSALDVDSPHPETEKFITPDATLSCVSSYSFEMMSTGILEVYVYMDSKSQGDHIIVLANEVSKSGNTVVAGTAILTPLSKFYFNGWHVLKINVLGTGVFNGYVTFLGEAAPESTIIVDSFRYIPPEYDDDCHPYDGEFVTTSPLLTPEPAEIGECVTYDFESNFDELFNTNRGLCTGFSNWNLQDYTTLPIDNPSLASELFISPESFVSCVSSFIFNAEVNGVVEVNAYMEAAESTDQIAVLVSKIADDGIDYVIGSTVLTPLHETYTDGWHVLRIPLNLGDSFRGYVSFLGMASNESIVLIDSFRYIPPTLTTEQCKLYEDGAFETTTPLPETVAPIGTGEDCVTYNFEHDFEKQFDNSNVLCSGYSSWHLGDYYSLAIESIDPHSKTFIAPNETSSCVSSFIFRMIPGGVVEVNVYMESASDLDYIIVLAKKVVPNGVDTVAGFQLYYATNSNFVKGWNVLGLTINDFSIFNGYITLIGSTAEESIVLIDSFRYIPPNSTEKCEIY